MSPTNRRENVRLCGGRRWQPGISSIMQIAFRTHMTRPTTSRSSHATFHCRKKFFCAIFVFSRLFALSFSHLDVLQTAYYSDSSFMMFYNCKKRRFHFPFSASFRAWSSVTFRLHFQHPPELICSFSVIIYVWLCLLCSFYCHS